MYRKIISLVVVLTFCIMCVCGCKKKDANETGKEITPTEEITQEPTQEPTEEPTPSVASSTYEDGKYISFEDGAFGFIELDTAPGDADKATLDVVDYNGSKALKVTTTQGKVPYIGIDASSLLGSEITKLNKMTLDLTAEYPDGNFYSVSGHIYAYSGTERNKSEDNWAIYMESKTTKQVEAILEEGEAFVEGAQNLFILAKQTDNALLAGETPVVLYLDNIAFYDADGNALAVNTSATFDRPAGFGEDDRSNLTNVAAETVLEASGECDAAWGQAVTLTTIKNDNGVFDPELLKKGCIVTVWYSSSCVPELVLQSWSGGEGWAKIAPAFVNDSGTIAQFTYDDMITGYLSEDFTTLDNFIIGATEDAIKVTKISIGTQAGEEVVLEGAMGKCGAWGQAVTLTTLKNENGVFDPEWIKKGVVFKVTYTGVLPEVVLQSWSGGAEWAKVAPAADTGSEATFTYEDMIAAYASEDLSTLDNFIVGATDGDIEVTKVTMMSVE